MVVALKVKMPCVTLQNFVLREKITVLFYVSLHYENSFLKHIFAVLIIRGACYPFQSSDSVNES